MKWVIRYAKNDGWLYLKKVAEQLNIFIYLLDDQITAESSG